MQKRCSWIPAIFILVVTFCLLLLSIREVEAVASWGSWEISWKQKDQNQKTFRYITVKEGETLWSLARTYYTSEYKDYNEWIEETKFSNHIADHIYAGERLLIPYFEPQNKNAEYLSNTISSETDRE